MYKKVIEGYADEASSRALQDLRYFYINPMGKTKFEQVDDWIDAVHFQLTPLTDKNRRSDVDAVIRRIHSTCQSLTTTPEQRTGFYNSILVSYGKMMVSKVGEYKDALALFHSNGNYKFVNVYSTVYVMTWHMLFISELIKLRSEGHSEISGDYVGKENLTVHHKSYDNMFNERPDDLIAITHREHNKIHGG